LAELAKASFGGGRYYRVATSQFYVADLMPTSGVFSTELFIYESVAGSLVLRLHVPRQINLEMKAELGNGQLVVSDRHYREKGAWQIRFHLAPTSAKK
jgi:hypothetical protein